MRAVTDSPISFPGLFGDWEFTLSSKALDIGNGIYVDFMCLGHAITIEGI